MFLPSVCCAQAIIESSDEHGDPGKTLSFKYNAMFGIKADARWKCKTYEVQTPEFYKTDKKFLTKSDLEKIFNRKVVSFSPVKIGYKVIIIDKFRAYDSFKDSIIDRNMFLYQNKRYRDNGVFTAKNYIEQANALEMAGYATDPNYAESIINICETFN